jgi:uncharacterized membrane protein required for colicin V production
MMNFSAFTYLDYAVCIIMTLSVILAFIRGFIGSFLSLLGWILSIYLAYIAFPIVKPLIEQKISNQILVIMIGHAGLLVIFLVIFGIFNLLATAAVKGMTSGIIDRSLGAAFGVIRGLIITSSAFLVFTVGIAIFNGAERHGNSKKEENFNAPKWVTESQTYPILKDGSKILASFIPDSFYQRFESMYSELTSKTMDDRFVDTSIQKLRNVIDARKVELIEQELQEKSHMYSAGEMRQRKLKGLLEQYEEQDDLKSSGTLSDSEMQRLRKILNDSE